MEHKDSLSPKLAFSTVWSSLSKSKIIGFLTQVLSRPIVHELRVSIRFSALQRVCEHVYFVQNRSLENWRDVWYFLSPLSMKNANSFSCRAQHLFDHLGIKDSLHRVRWSLQYPWSHIASVQALVDYERQWVLWKFGLVLHTPTCRLGEK